MTIKRAAQADANAGVRVWKRLVQVGQQTMAAVEADLKAAGLPPLIWYDALWELEQAGEEGLRPFELERAMLLAQYNLSRLLDRLEAAGHVARCRCPGDGRGQMIRLTDAGRLLRQTMWPVYANAIHTHITVHLNQSEADQLADALALLVRPRP